MLVPQTLWNLRTVENDLRTVGHFESCFWICQNQNCHQSSFWKKCWCFRELLHSMINLRLLFSYFLCFFHRLSSSNECESDSFEKFFTPFEKFFTTPPPPEVQNRQMSDFRKYDLKKDFFCSNMLLYPDRICGLVGKNIVGGVKNFWKLGKKLLIVDVYIMNIKCWQIIENIIFKS